jgi:hypothetical protein
MTFAQEMAKQLAVAALNRLGRNYAETHVVGSIYVTTWNMQAYTVTVGGTEYGPYDYEDAKAAIIEHIEARLRKEQQQAVTA